MSDGSALLRAILDDPDDDAPRLICADWLEENGDPARAAFIRAQIRLARLPQDDPDRDRLVQTERTLWKANRDAWKAWLPEWARVTEFHRGFVEEVRCHAADFIAHADEVRLRTPLLTVRLDGTRELAVPLFRSRALEGLRTIRLSMRVERGEWEQLRVCPYLGRLTTLDVSSNSCIDELIAVLIQSGAFPKVRSLRLRWCAVTDYLVYSLVGHPWAERLRSLDLGHNNITREGADALVGAASLIALESLNVRGNPLVADRLAVARLRWRYGDRVKL